MLGLVWGIIVGIAIGGGGAWVALNGIGTGPVMMYLLAMAGGVLVGLLAGKPFWAKGAKIEAGLKAVFGAVASAALMAGLRSWVSFSVDLSAYGLGQGPIATNPVIALPITATLLALLYSVDNLFGKGDSGAGPSKKRVLDSADRARVIGNGGDEQDAELIEEHKSRTKR